MQTKLIDKGDFYELIIPEHLLKKSGINNRVEITARKCEITIVTLPNEPISDCN